MTSSRSTRILMLPLFLLALAGTAVAADGAKSKKSAVPLEDQLASAAEEQDRLVRERKDLQERQQALQSQLDTSKKLAAEKDALIKQLEKDIAALKAGKKGDKAKAAQ